MPSFLDTSGNYNHGAFYNLISEDYNLGKALYDGAARAMVLNEPTANATNDQYIASEITQSAGNLNSFGSCFVRQRG